MPIFDFKCNHCGKVDEVLVQESGLIPQCCGEVMNRQYTVENHISKYTPPLWVFRMDEIHKAQAQRGERLRMIYPKEVSAT